MSEEEKETTEVEETKEETPTPEEQLKTAREEITRVTAELESKTKGLKTAHQTLTDKDQKLKEQAGSNARMDGIEERLEIVATLLDRRLTTGEMEEGEKVNLKQEFAQLKERTKQEREAEKTKLAQEENVRVADGLWTRAQVFGTYQDNDDVADIYDALVDGKSYKAERIIKRLEGKPETKETPKESEDDRIERLVTEKYNAKLEEDGLLHTESAEPSGRSRTRDELRAKHAAGEITTEEAEKAGLKF
ncbi:hypothetical protein LCGC14_0560840 [marine sediment metagenome]|uniref:Uncharacterized protein n=1 Tax=marine sediment metagenome TaxID=412755 RepID=A0A0F9UV67_9ZZZZ